MSHNDLIELGQLGAKKMAIGEAQTAAEEPLFIERARWGDMMKIEMEGVNSRDKKMAWLSHAEFGSDRDDESERTRRKVVDYLPACEDVHHYYDIHHISWCNP